jgi:hypothetical protein
MASKGIYNIKNVIKGDTFDGVSFTLSDLDDVAIDLTGATIKIDFKNKGNAVMKTISIGSGITVNNATAGIFQIDSFLVILTTGSLEYDIEITFPSGMVKTYVTGTFNIIN